jgi:hypothetical protein
MQIYLRFTLPLVGIGGYVGKLHWFFGFTFLKVTP